MLRARLARRGLAATTSSLHFNDASTSSALANSNGSAASLKEVTAAVNELNLIDNHQHEHLSSDARVSIQARLLWVVIALSPSPFLSAPWYLHQSNMTPWRDIPDRR